MPNATFPVPQVNQTLAPMLVFTDYYGSRQVQAISQVTGDILANGDAGPY
jgi:hypothetical protein